MCFKVHTTKLQQLKKKFNTYRDNNSESTHYLTEINRILWMCTQRRQIKVTLLLPTAHMVKCPFEQMEKYKMICLTLNN